MVKIRVIAPPEDKYGIKCPFRMNPTRIVIHNTAGSSSAAREIAYMHRNNEEKSYHYAVDDVEAIRGLPLNRNGWHAGDGGSGKGNREGIGIEICYSFCSKKVNGVKVADEEKWQKNYKKKFEKAQENAAELTAYLLHKFGWGMDVNRITKHQDYSGKHCPHRTLDDYGWSFFIDLVKQKYEEMYEGEKPMTKEEKKAFDELKKQLTELQAELKVYHTWEELPKYAVNPLKALHEKGFFRGSKPNDLNVNKVKVECLVVEARILKAMGIIDYEE